MLRKINDLTGVDLADTAMCRDQAAKKRCFLQPVGVDWKLRSLGVKFMKGAAIMRTAGLAVVLLGVIACGGGGGDGDVIVLNPLDGPTQFFQGMDVADIDNDGLGDIVAASYINDGKNNFEYALSVFKQSPVAVGDFGTATRVVYSRFGSQNKLVLADLRRLGRQDAIAHGFGSGGFVVFANDDDQSGNFKAPVHYGPLAPIDSATICILGAMAVGDLNGDLYPDVAVDDGDVIKYYPQDAMNPGTFLDGVEIGSGACAIAIGDVNADGLNDLVTFDPEPEKPGNSSDSRLFYYRQAPGLPGDFHAPVRIDLPFGLGRDIGIGDFNNHGLPDIIAFGGSGDVFDGLKTDFSIHLQTSANIFVQLQRTTTQGEGFVGAHDIADLDQDGDDEIIFGQRGGGSAPNHIEIFNRDAGGIYRSAALLVVPNEQAISRPEFFRLKAADLNNDNQLDIAASTYEIFVFFARPGQPGKFDKATIIASQQ